MYAVKDHVKEAERSHEMTRETEPDSWRGSVFAGFPQKIQLTCSDLGSQSCDVLVNSSLNQFPV